MSANCMLLELREHAATGDNASKKPTAIRSSVRANRCGVQKALPTARVGSNRGLSTSKATEKAM